VRRAGDREVLGLPAHAKQQAKVICFPSLPFSLQMAGSGRRVAGGGGSLILNWQSAGWVLYSNQLQVTLRLTTHARSLHPCVCARVRARRRKSCGDKSVPGLCIRIHRVHILYRKVHSSELPVQRIYASLHSYLRSEKYTISCEKTKRPSRPPAYVLS